MVFHVGISERDLPLGPLCWVMFAALGEPGLEWGGCDMMH